MPLFGVRRICLDDGDGLLRCRESVTPLPPCGGVVLGGFLGFFLCGLGTVLVLLCYCFARMVFMVSGVPGFDGCFFFRWFLGEVVGWAREVFPVRLGQYVMPQAGR